MQRAPSSSPCLQALLAEVLSEYPVSLSQHRPERPVALPGVEQTYVISLRDNCCRQSYIRHALATLGLAFTMVTVDRVSAETTEKIQRASVGKRLQSGEIGCCLSHLWCLRDAVRCGLASCLILEDDALFCYGFVKKLRALVTDDRRPPFDLLMLGASDANRAHNAASCADGVYYPTKEVMGSVASIYSARFASEVLAHKLAHFSNFDCEIATLRSDRRIAVACPNLVLADLSTSNLHHHFGNTCSASALRGHRAFVRACYGESLDYTQYRTFAVHFLQYVWEHAGQLRLFQPETTLASLIQQYHRHYNMHKFLILNVHCGFALDEVRSMVRKAALLASPGRPEAILV